MRTTLDLPRKLLEDAVRLSGAKNKTQAIIWALEEMSRKKRLEKLWAMRGTIDLNLDLKASRGR